VEGSSVFRLNNSDEYILMYDLYGSGRYEFQRSRDLSSFSAKPESFTKNFDPRHGSVTGITRDEARRLHNRYGGVPASLLRPETAGDHFHFQSKGNPIITHYHTADPAAFVRGDTLWLFTGHDLAGGQNGYRMKDWLVFFTTDLKNWTEYPVPLKIKDFAWDKSNNAYAAQAIERNGKFYWYVSTNGSGIGVAVGDRPKGRPYKDALEKPLLTKQDCFASSHGWCCIDPAVFIDNDGQAWLFWGNGQCYYVKLKENMTELDGEIKQIKFDGFVFEEAPWIHKYNGKYYLSYATGFPEKIAYAIADKIDGPYQYKGILNEIAGNSNTNHQSIVEFKGEWYFIYHNGDKPSGYFHGPDCCTASGHRIISMLPTFFYAEQGKDFYINQYLPARYAGKDFGFEVNGNYPESENITLTVTSEKAVVKTVNLRIPLWCKVPEVIVNGNATAGIQSGAYLKLTRKWAKGDKIEITLPMETQWIKREHHSKYTTYRLPQGEIMYKEEPTDKIPYAFVRGPVVYALDMVWNKPVCNDDVNMEKDIRVQTGELPVLTDKPHQNMLGPVYRTNALYKDGNIDVVLSPFTNIGQWFRPGEQKPQQSAIAFTYGIWLYNSELK
jgi:hypothetical protein